MADIYVRSTDGLDADNGSTWALAKATLAGAAAIDAAGDTIYVSQSHAESSAATQTIALAGTAANPVKIICGNDSAAPPTSAETTATVTTTGANGINVNGSGYIYGVTFNIATGSTGNSFYGAYNDQDSQIYEQCNFKLLSTAATATVIGFGSSTATLESSATLINCGFSVTVAARGLLFRKVKVDIKGGSILSGSAAISNFIVSTQDIILVTIKDFDFTNAATGMNILYSAAQANGRIDVINCKMPASWSGGPVAGAPINPGLRVSMYNCDSGATNYRLWIETYSGSIKSETTIVKTGGATDGTTPLSWKLVTTANANEYVAPLITDDMATWINTTGARKTITVDILHDSVTALTDAEVWLEIDYLGSSATPLGTPSSDKRATVLTTATAQTTSTATWTTTGITNPNKQKLEVTFTPNMNGFIYARVCLAKASYTVYVDPQVTIS